MRCEFCQEVIRLPRACECFVCVRSKVVAYPVAYLVLLNVN